MNRIRRILCPIDFSETSRRALDHAAAIARRYKASLSVLYVFPNMPVMDVPPPHLGAAGRAEIMADLRQFILSVPGSEHVNAHVKYEVVLVMPGAIEIARIRRRLRRVGR